MSDIDLSQLPNDSAITGSEQLIANDAGTATDITPNQLADFVVTTKGGQPGGLALFEATNQALATKATLDPVTGKVPASLLDIPSGGGGGTGPAAWLPVAAWAASASYVVGPPASVVTYLGETYVCTSAHTAGSSFDATKFIKIAQKGADGTGGGGSGGAVTSVSGRTGDITLTKSDVGLTNVDNTSDANKPLSSAAVAALATKATLDPTTGKVPASQLDIPSGGGIVSVSGMTATVAPFSAGSFAFEGGTQTVPGAGTWYVGVDILSKQIRTLPRLGHDGWVPVGRVVATSTTITDVKQIAPVLPVSRIPRFAAKVKAGQPVKVVVMGSSLTVGTTPDTWAGMLTNALSSISDYKIPTSVTIQNIGVVGSSNQHQLAELGFAGANVVAADGALGYPSYFSLRRPVTGRSAVFNDVDLVIIGMLANDMDYRMKSLEAVMRGLRRRGVEAIIVTDNSHNASQVNGAGPFRYDDLAQIKSAPYYNDGATLINLAKAYGFHVADTAAHIAEAVLRYPTSRIYRDGIHQFQAVPAGRAAQPAGGHEVWARAIRSCMPFDQIAEVLGPDTFDSSVGSWVAANATYGSVSIANGALKATKTAQATNASTFGVRRVAPNGIQSAVAVGDTIRITGTVTDNTTGFVPKVIVRDGAAPNAFLTGAIGAVTSASVDLFPAGTTSGPFDVTIQVVTAAAAARNLAVIIDALANGSQAVGSSFSLNNIEIRVNSANSGSVYDPIETREFASQMNMPPRLVTDYKTPGDAFIVLPKDEQYLVSGTSTLRGTLGAHPASPNSFAKRWAPPTTNATPPEVIGPDAFDAGAGFWTAVSGGASIAVVNSALQVTKNTATGTWGARRQNAGGIQSALAVGDTVRVTGTVTENSAGVVLRSQLRSGVGGFSFLSASTNIFPAGTTTGAFDATVTVTTATAAASNVAVIIDAAGSEGTSTATFSIDNVQITVMRGAAATADDILVLTTGQRAAISAFGAVAFGVFSYALGTDTAPTLEVYRNGVPVVPTITLSGKPGGQENFWQLISPTTLNKSDALPTPDTFEIRVTAGTLRLCALVVETSEQEFIPAERVGRVGTGWTPGRVNGAAGMPGFATDTVADYASVRCPSYARRVSWLVSSQVNSKPTDSWSGRTLTNDANASASAAAATVKVLPGHLGTSEEHYIQATAANAATDQATNGYGLHVGGAILTLDR